MARKIENFKYSVVDSFKNFFYVIPDYQREYIWSDKEVNKLLDDINEEIDGNLENEYFIGTILVTTGNEDNHFEVIDGQQRLTTLYLMLLVLRYLIDSDKHKNEIYKTLVESYTDNKGDFIDTLKLSPRYENAEDALKAIVEKNDTPEVIESFVNSNGIKIYGSITNILNAYKTIFYFFKENYKTLDEQKKYWAYLSKKVVFIQIESDINSALKIFETINERGLGLNPMDLLKNLLFTNVKLDEFTKLKNEWKKITKPLEENKEKPLRFLRYFLMANYKIENDRSDSTVREDEIYEWFTNKTNIALCNYQTEPFVFVRKIIKNVDTFMSFTQGKGNDGKDNVYMNNIRKLTGGAFSLHYVLLLASYTLPKELFDYLLKQLETFLFYYILTRTPTKELERNFSNWADELRTISGISDADEKKLKLNQFVIERFQKSTLAKAPELADALKRYNFYSLQQYRTRYILAKFTQHVDMAYKGMNTPGNLDEYTVLEIEHILPNTPNDELLADFKEKNEDKDYGTYKIKLGNLTLLEKPINIVAGRDFFRDKKTEYRKCKNYLTSSLVELNTVGNNSSINRINEKLHAFGDEWNADTIDTRQKMLITLSDLIWKIEPLEK